LYKIRNKRIKLGIGIDIHSLLKLFNHNYMLRHTYYDQNETNMPENKLIDLQEYYEVEYWSKRFGVKPELLKRAVIESDSTVAEEVEKYIKTKFAR